MISQEDAMLIIKPHAEALYSIPMDAWNEYHAKVPQELLIYFCSRTRASGVHNLMVKNAAKYAAQFNHSVGMFERQKMAGIVIEGLAIRFKKADEENRTRNQPSAQVRDFRNQLPIDGVPAVHNLELVYVLDENEVEPIEIRLVHPSGDNASWWVRLIGGRADPMVFDFFPPQPPQGPEGPKTIKPAHIGPKKTGDVIPLRKEDGNKDDKN